MKAWIFVVTWCVLNEVPVANKPTIDEFGRESPSVTLEYNFRIESDCGYKREFFDRTEAFAFYSEAKKQEPDSAGDWVIRRGWNLENVKIDSFEVAVTPSQH